MNPAQLNFFSDWGVASEPFDEIALFAADRELSLISEAQTRFDVIDRLIKEVLAWSHGQIIVEEREIVQEGAQEKKVVYIDYLLRAGEEVILIEAKRFGAAFPTPTKRRRLKLSGSILGKGEIAKARAQAEEYARSKRVDVVVVTNGRCWCFYRLKGMNDASYGYLLFPFDNQGDGKKLYDWLGRISVQAGSLHNLENSPPQHPENRLLSQVNDADARVDRNNVADYISPALNNALYADAILADTENLRACYVFTEARTKFDKQLGVHLVDIKPTTVKPAKRIKSGKAHGPIREIFDSSSVPSYAPPVTVIIGPVGAGKSTYLKHFELIAGREIINTRSAHWVYIDFEEMGLSGNPREFMYSKLRDYLLQADGEQTINYNNTIKPAYEDLISGLARGHYNRVYNKDPNEFEKIVAERIDEQFKKVEPYVDRVFGYLAQNGLCVIVLDNVDLYEDEELETKVFSEGLALSKRVRCNVIVSIRDRTFVRHRSSSVFDAYELRKLWMDPPPIKSILKKRFTYAKKILDGAPARIELPGGKYLKVPDLGVFFNIVQSSILGGSAGDFVDAVSDTNIRKGLTLVTHFLTSGHIQADRALKQYIAGETNFVFPYHEIFKGCMLAQWRHYKEERSDSVNLFDSRLPSPSLRLARLYILKMLVDRAKTQSSVEVPVTECIDLFTQAGISSEQILSVLNHLYSVGLVRSTNAEDISSESTVVITRSGGYYVNLLCKEFVYVEACMHDTALDNKEYWLQLVDITREIERERSTAERMKQRRKRIKLFLRYLRDLESRFLEGIASNDNLRYLDEIERSVMNIVDHAVRVTDRRERQPNQRRRKRSPVRK